MQSPRSLEEEHEGITEALGKYAELPDQTGEAVKRLEHALEPHFKKEALLVMPVLGSLSALVTEEKPKDLKDIAESQGSILQEYENMFQEHAEIRRLISESKLISLEEKHQDVADFLDSLAHHTRIEEEVLYPAALLAGTVAKCLLPSARFEAIA